MSEPSCASVSCFVTVVIKRNYNAYSLFVFHFVSKEKYDSLKDSAVRLKVISSVVRLKDSVRFRTRGVPFQQGAGYSYFST